MSTVLVTPIDPAKLVHQALQVMRRDERNRSAHKRGAHGTGSMCDPKRVPTCPLCDPQKEAAK